MEREELKKLFTHYYWIKRSQEFSETHDSELTWKNIQSKIDKKRRKSTLRNTVIVTSVAATVAIVSFFVFKPSFPEELNSIVPISQIANSVVLITDDKMYDLQAKTSVELNETNLVYDSVGVRVIANEAADPTAMQTISVPFAKRYRVILPDSTLVWLNSGTKLSFGKSFSGGVRSVSLIGEAYFEVKRDTNRPFMIQLGENCISVLGTTFTVTNYDDIPVSTTLIEGSVELASRDSRHILIPNQRAEIDTKGNISFETVDAAQAVSWISGVYEFNDKSLGYVASYISRMYGVVIRIDDEELRERHMTGIINSNKEISYSLSLIKKVLGVKITLVENEIVIQ